ncbi:MAG: hypothetical protein ACRDKT_02515 [Actinomycetota bacterium]
MKAEFSRWDGSQDPFGADVDVGAVLDEISDELLSGYGLDWSLRELMRRGMQGRSGLDDLLRRLREQRLQMAERANLAGPLAEVRKELDEIVALERNSLASDQSDDARMKEMELDTLPNHPAGALKGLDNYDFSSGEARARFEALKEKLKRDVLNSYFKNMVGAMRDITPEDIARIKDMLAELNEMIAARDRGDTPDFEGFMSRYGDMFPENPKNLDELLQVMAQRMAAMSRLMASLTPDQRRELVELAGALLDDMDLAWQLDQLGSNLRQLMPELPWDEASEFYGDDMMPMSAAVDAIERLSEMEDLEDTLHMDHPGASLEDIDEEQLRRSLDEGAVEDLRWLKEIEKALEKAGLVKRSGKLELTARGARLIGERSLTRVLEKIRREPTHRASGGQAEPTGQTRRWSFGDPDPISVEKTVYNAVLRGGPQRRVALTPEDFEVIETESRPRTATALLLDLSLSMPLRGHWIHAKRMALSLQALIDSKYPQDALYLIGFSDFARQMEPVDLATVGWEHVQGTNMEHAFILARRALADDPRPIKQVIMVTDGEPTAHLENGYAAFSWPPTRETFERTLREAMRLARSDISINVFLLEESEGLRAFTDRLCALTGGEVFRAESSGITGAVIDNYERARRAIWGAWS